MIFLWRTDCVLVPPCQPWNLSTRSCGEVFPIIFDGGFVTSFQRGGFEVFQLKKNPVETSDHPDFCENADAERKKKKDDVQ